VKKRRHTGRQSAEGKTVDQAMTFVPPGVRQRKECAKTKSSNKAAPYWAKKESVEHAASIRLGLQQAAQGSD
jgi:hypothetical protein